MGEIRLADSAGLARLDGMDWMDWMSGRVGVWPWHFVIYTRTHTCIYIYMYMYKPRLGEANSTSNSTPPGTPHHFFNQQKSRRFGLLSFSRAVPSKGSALPHAIALSECQVVKVAWGIPDYSAHRDSGISHQVWCHHVFWRNPKGR